ncbi:hypothetical protein V6U90_32405 [Micromonospora sp. CPCC 206060]|uniref:hypothetical protein n=1 Tax=Micromonospora sp. CPCC 206060 TaxID=3122406 RepID=UPI002FEFA050
MNVYPFIEAEKARQDGNVKHSCELLEVSRSAYYQHRTAGLSRRERDDADLTAQTVDIHAVSAGTYGAPRVRAELAAQGRRHSRPDFGTRWQAAKRCGSRPTFRIRSRCRLCRICAR